MEKTPDYTAGYTAGERDGRATGFWEGYAEAVADTQKAGLIPADPLTRIFRWLAGLTRRMAIRRY